MIDTSRYGLPSWPLATHISDGSTQWTGFPFCSQQSDNREDVDDTCHTVCTSVTWDPYHGTGLVIFTFQTSDFVRDEGRVKNKTKNALDLPGF
jgi:hypothetical protein